jgi:hypothetical protein
MAGSTFTKRVTAAEVADGYLELSSDLQPYADLIEGSVPLRRGGRASIELAAEPGRAIAERLIGPAGWLGDAAVGDLVGVRLADGFLQVMARPDSIDPEPAAEAFGSAARRLIEGSEFDPPRASLVSALWDALAATPRAFEGVLPPLSELARDADLQLTDTMVLPAEADVDDIQATTDAVHDAIARVHLGADDAMLADLRRLRAVTRRLELGEEVGPDELAAAATALAGVDVTDAYLREVRAGGGSPGCLGGAAASSR